MGVIERLTWYYTGEKLGLTSLSLSRVDLFLSLNLFFFFFFFFFSHSLTLSLSISLARWASTSWRWQKLELKNQLSGVRYGATEGIWSLHQRYEVRIVVFMNLLCSENNVGWNEKQVRCCLHLLMKASSCFDLK